MDVSRAVIGTAAYATVPATEDHLIISDLIVINGRLTKHPLPMFLCVAFRIGYTRQCSRDNQAAIYVKCRLNI
jgi:hypothetical protein